MCMCMRHLLGGGRCIVSSGGRGVQLRVRSARDGCNSVIDDRCWRLMSAARVYAARACTASPFVFNKACDVMAYNVAAKKKFGFEKSGLVLQSCILDLVSWRY